MTIREESESKKRKGEKCWWQRHNSSKTDTENNNTYGRKTEAQDEKARKEGLFERELAPDPKGRRMYQVSNMCSTTINKSM